MRALRFVTIIVGTLITFAGMTTVASAQPPSTDIIGGGTATNAPWAARMFNNGQQRCSATIIASTFILTAKHCTNGTTPSAVTFRVGSLDQTTGGTLVRAVQYTSHPVADFTVVRIDRSVAATFSPLGTTVSVGQTAQVYGWGATCTNQPEINCQSRFLKVANVSVFSVNSQDAFGGIAVGARRINGITAGGDSGGPMFAGGRQVGVASTSDRQTTTFYTNITQYRPFIQSVAGV